ncbi:MAG: ATP-binding protein [Planctomycetota bacterium]
MSSLRARLLAGTILGTTIAFATGGVLVHQLARYRLERDTDAGLEQALGFAIDRLKLEFGRRELLTGAPLRPGTKLLISPTGRSDTLFVCRTAAGILVDASPELGEASAVIDLPEAGLDEVSFGDFVLASGARARGAALSFHPDRMGGGARGFGPPPWGGPEGRERRGRQGAPERSGPEDDDDLGRRPGRAPSDGRRPPESEVGRPSVAERANGAEGDFEGSAGPPRLIVLQAVEARQASLRHLALVLTSTWLFTCFIGSAALWLTIRRGLRPLEELRLQIADLDWRSGSASVEVRGAPEELAPVIAQLEASRQRIVSAFRRERRFVGDAAHELRTPVSGIKAILEVALRRQRTNEELEGYARECLSIASEMGRAVEALLTLGKLSRGEVALELADVDPRLLAEEAWKPLAVTAQERGVTLEVTGSTEPVVANRDLLSRAVANLVDNAVEYGVAPGVVRVHHERLDAASSIEVSNEVIEVAHGFVEHAFEPFWRGDSARTDAARHAGLGLALVNQIAELHGGEATLSVRDGRVVARLVIPDA